MICGKMIRGTIWFMNSIATQIGQSTVSPFMLCNGVEGESGRLMYSTKEDSVSHASRSRQYPNSSSF